MFKNNLNLFTLVANQYFQNNTTINMGTVWVRQRPQRPPQNVHRQKRGINYKKIYGWVSSAYPATTTRNKTEHLYRHTYIHIIQPFNYYIK